MRSRPVPANLLRGHDPATSANGFAHDLADPALQAWLAANQPRFLTWDATFDPAFDSGFGSAPLTPPPKRPELRGLRVPFRS